MKAIPRVIAGTAVVLAAVLTAAPIGAGLADLVLSPDHHGKQLTAGAAQKTAAEAGEPWSGGTPEGTSPPVGVDGSDVVPLSPRSLVSTAQVRSDVTFRTAAGSGAESPEARITDLAADLQTGVDAGEITQADADRVLGDMSSYIRGERTWPERMTV